MKSRNVHGHRRAHRRGRTGLRRRPHSHIPCAGAGVLNALRTILATAVAAYPAQFLREAACIHAHESRDWHIVNPPYAGGFQFTLGTWNVAGRNYDSLEEVAHSSPAEQTRRAYYIFTIRGGTWRRDWPATSRICGTR